MCGGGGRGLGATTNFCGVICYNSMVLYVVYVLI